MCVCTCVCVCMQVKNATYKANLMKLEQFVMVMFLKDTMVQPKESEVGVSQGACLSEVGVSQGACLSEVGVSEERAF